jgi:hypothetical protein
MHQSCRQQFKRFKKKKKKGFSYAKWPRWGNTAPKLRKKARKPKNARPNAVRLNGYTTAAGQQGR